MSLLPATCRAPAQPTNHHPPLAACLCCSAAPPARCALAQKTASHLAPGGAKRTAARVPMTTMSAATRNTSAWADTRWCAVRAGGLGRGSMCVLGGA